MREIGIREAKARLSQVLHDVQEGTEWVVTDRGKPIARIVPVDLSTLSLGDRIKLLEERGMLEPPTSGRVTPEPLPVKTGIAQRMLLEDRSEGY